MSQKIFDNDLVAIRKSIVTLKLNKPAYVVMCILDLSRLLMYEFHYDWIKDKYGNKSRLLFTDTDNLMYETKTEDVSEDIIKDKELLDFSKYSVKSKYYDSSNKLAVCKMKDETDDVAIEKSFGLKERLNKNVAATIKTSLVKWLSVRLQTKWFWARVQLQSLKFQVSRLLRARSSLTIRQL